MNKRSVSRPADDNSEEMDDSPACKRTRFESPSEEQWSFSRENVVLDDVYDIGICRLEETDSEESEEEMQASYLCSYMSPKPSVSDVKHLSRISPDEWQKHIKVGIEATDIPIINHFEDLSDEMVLHILHFLPKRYLSVVALVCKRWYRLSQDESLWTRMDIANRQLPSGAMGYVMSRQVLIMRLSQAEIAYPPILPNCRAFAEDFRCKLLLLDLSMAQVSCPSLIQIFNKCCRLKKISLEHVTVNAQVMVALSRSTELEVINLAMAEGLDDQGIRALLGNCRKIRELNLAWTYLNSISATIVSLNLSMSVERLNLSGCRKYLTDENVYNIVTSCPNLRELDLSDCTGLTGEAVKYTTTLESLCFLALSRCYQVQYKSLLHLKKVKTLLYLDMHGGYIGQSELNEVQDTLGPNVQINKFKFSSIARPTVGVKRSSIWNMKVRD